MSEEQTDVAEKQEVEEAEPFEGHAGEEDDLEMLVDMTKKFANIATQKKQQMNVGMALMQQQEKYLNQLQRYKETRVERLMLLRSQHRYIIEMVADYLGVEPDVVMNGVIDYARHIELMDSLFAEGGRRAIMFYYQEGDPPEVETGRPDNILPSGTKVMRIFVTDGSEHKLNGLAIVCYRISHLKQIETKNLNTDIFFAPLEMKLGNPVAAIEWLLHKIFCPTIAIYKEWGALNLSTAAKLRKQEFLSDLKFFHQFIKETKTDLDFVMKFTIDEYLYLTYMTNPDTLRHAALDSSILEQIENVVRGWMKQIELSLIQTRQLRKESDKIGPFAEMVYWRRNLAKCMSILEHMNSEKSNMYIQCLIQGRSKLIKHWKNLDNEMTTACNESHDIVKYLYSLEKFYEPLYRYTPEELPHHIPVLLFSIRMVYTTSAHYNTTDKITALLVKCTNQIVHVCKLYINENMSKNVWKMKKAEVIRRIQVCLDLYLKYYQCFQHTKKIMEEAGEPPFAVSEQHIFLKYEKFKIRLEKIVDILQITLKYSILQSSTIEDIDIYANKFSKFFKTISSKPYDALDHRIPNFDEDYSMFKQCVVDTEWELEEFVAKTLEKSRNVERILYMLGRFDKLNLACLHLEERYLEAMELFEKEMENTRDRYNLCRSKNSLPYNMTPYASRIKWIRNLHDRIYDPMQIFRQQAKVIRHKKVQKCIQMYNALISVFIHYEKQHHRAWMQNLDRVGAALSTPLILKHPKTRMLVVNYDPFIEESIREIQCMLKFDLDIPDVGKVIFFSKNKIRYTYEKTKELLETNITVRKSIIKLFIPMIRQKMLELEIAFQPGLSAITWTSPNITEYFEVCETTCQQVGRFIKDVTDLKEARIDEALANVAETCLVNLPKHALFPEELLQLNVKHAKQMGRDLELKSYTIEKAVFVLINQFMDLISEPELQDGKYNWLDREKATKPVASLTKLITPDEMAAFKEIDRSQTPTLELIHEACTDLFSFFNSKMIEALTACMKMSLEVLKQRETISSLVSELSETPLVKTEMILRIPNAILVPSLDEIQSLFNTMMFTTLDIMKDVTIWAQRDLQTVKEDYNPFEETAGKKKTYYRSIYDQKEINRSIMSLQGATLPLKQDLNKLCQAYLCWAFLWAEDREDQISAFVAKKPLIVEIREEFMKYENRNKAIKDIPDSHFIGAIQVEMEKYKIALLVESNAWKYTLGNQLTELYKARLNEMVNFITEQQKVLQKKILNLDDVRLAMACLERIRSNFIELDMDLELMEGAFASFAEFKIPVSQQDTERMDTLRYNFSKMIIKVRSYLFARYFSIVEKTSPKGNYTYPGSIPS